MLDALTCFFDAKMQEEVSAHVALPGSSSCCTTSTKTPALAHLTMAVNVSAFQFKHADFVNTVLSTLGQVGAAPRLLKLELTESMLVHDVEAVIAKMGTLKAHGVVFSLVVALAESVGLVVIAEWVELQAQADLLAHQGCHPYQGYLFSRPLPLAAFETFLRQTQDPR